MTKKFTSDANIECRTEDADDGWYIALAKICTTWSFI